MKMLYLFNNNKNLLKKIVELNEMNMNLKKKQIL